MQSSTFIQSLVTRKMLEMEHSRLGINTMPVDALAPKVCTALSDMVLVV